MSANLAKRIDSQAASNQIYYPESDGQPMAETDVHREQMTYLIESFQTHFAGRDDVYATGNIMFYYEEGNPKKCFSPDVMVCFGVEKGFRRVYKFWEETVMPQVVFEISSRKTWGDDLHRKLNLCDRLGTLEYYIFDPEYDYLPEPIAVFKRVDGELQQIEIEGNEVFSETVGLKLVDTGTGLRLFDPQTNAFIPTRLELNDENAKLRTRLAELEAQLK